MVQRIDERPVTTDVLRDVEPAEAPAQPPEPATLAVSFETTFERTRGAGQTNIAAHGPTVAALGGARGGVPSTPLDTMSQAVRTMVTRALDGHTSPAERATLDRWTSNRIWD